MELQWPLILFTFFVCFASGTLLMQGVLTALGKGKTTQLPALISSLALLVIGGIAVFLHLEHWERIFNGFGHISSGITLEFIGCVVFFIVLVVFFLMMRRSDDGVAPKWCGVLAIIVGIGMPVVTGDSYLMAAIPAWNTPLLPLYYAVNTVFMGALAMLVIMGILSARCSNAGSSVVVNADGEVNLCTKTGFIAGIVQAVVVIAYAIYIASTSSQFSNVQYYFDPTLPDTSMVDTASIVNSILTGSLAPLFYLGVLIVGIVAVLAVLYFMNKKQASGSQVAVFGGSGLACAIVGGICWRCALYVVAVSVFALY